MPENEPIKSCDLCGYKCSAVNDKEGRDLTDLEGVTRYKDEGIECCKARKILIGNPNHPKNLARSIVEIPKGI